jgi:hypothetical protein
MFKHLGFSPLKQKFAGKSAGNQRILALGTKIKIIYTCMD